MSEMMRAVTGIVLSVDEDVYVRFKGVSVVGGGEGEGEGKWEGEGEGGCDFDGGCMCGVGFCALRIGVIG